MGAIKPWHLIMLFCVCLVPLVATGITVAVLLSRRQR